jgi:dihydroorotate dehydrogenase (NAD+) catalytic subunit
MPSEEFDPAALAGGRRLGFGRGGVSGPGLLSLGLEAIRTVREHTALPVIGVGGVSDYGAVRQSLDAGASVVGVGTAALADPRIPERLVAAWEADG